MQGGVEQSTIDNALKQTLVLILAGGQGSRLGDLTKHRSKPAVEFGGSYKIIDFVLSNCFNSGLRQVGVLTQYKSHCLIRHLFKGWGHLNHSYDGLMEILPAAQQTGNDWYQGTADACYQNLGFIDSVKPKYVMILSGDHIYKQDYRGFLASHLQHSAQLTVSCLNVPVAEAAGQFGVMSVGEHERITRFEEKPLYPDQLADNPGYSLASMGNYIFDAEFLANELTRDAKDKKSSHDFGKDIIPRLISQCRVHAHRFSNGTAKSSPYWRDVGTLDSYWLAHMDLLKPDSQISLQDSHWPLLTHQPPLPPVNFIADDDGRSCSIKRSIIGQGCQLENAWIEHSLLSVGTSIEEGASIRNSVLLPNCQIGKGVKLNRVIVDEGCIVPDGMIIGGDSSTAVEQGFQLTPKGIVIVTQKKIDELRVRTMQCAESAAMQEQRSSGIIQQTDITGVSSSNQNNTYVNQVKYSGSC